MSCPKFTHTLKYSRRKIKKYTNDSCKLCRCTSGLLELSFVMHLTTCLINKHTTRKVVPTISGNRIFAFTTVVGCLMRSLPVLNDTEKKWKKYHVSIFKNSIIKSITNTDNKSTELCSSTWIQANYGLVFCTVTCSDLFSTVFAHDVVSTYAYTDSP